MREYLSDHSRKVAEPKAGRVHASLVLMKLFTEPGFPEALQSPFADLVLVP